MCNKNAIKLKIFGSDLFVLKISKLATKAVIKYLQKFVLFSKDLILYTVINVRYGYHISFKTKLVKLWKSAIDSFVREMSIFSSHKP